MATRHSAAVGREGSPHIAAAGRVIALFRRVEGCSQALRGAVERLAASHELAATQLMALWACGEIAAGVGQSDLAARIGVSPAQASALVEHLRQRGLIESHREATDRRRQRWTVTVSGRSVLIVVVDELANLARRIGTTFDEIRQGRMETSLEQLAAAVSESPSAVMVPSDVPRLRVVSPTDAEDDRDASTMNHPSQHRASREAPR
ncbi:MAG: MarR family winged helix-turn-helix transcriptional regulator [Pirellulales bacterium]